MRYQEAGANAIQTAMSRLEGKIAVVTGAASGIGKASVELFRTEGATVIGADRAAGADVTMDAGDERDVQELLDGVARDHGRIDVIYANAGIANGFSSISDETGSDWAEILRVNLIGPFLAVKYGVPHMRARGNGSIIFTASVAGLRSGAGGAAYSASKAGVINFAQTAAQQLSATGIRVNAVCPGIIETGMTKEVYDLARSTNQAHRIGELAPIKRGGTPVDVARAALFLASDESSYVNGTALLVDGGLASSHPTSNRFNIRMQ